MVVAHGGVGVTNTLDQHTTRGLKKIRVMKKRPSFALLYISLNTVIPTLSLVITKLYLKTADQEDHLFLCL